LLRSAKAVIAATRVSSNAEGWFIALLVIAVEAVVMYGFVLDVGWRALEPSAVNVTGSIAPLMDGVTQELFFRGYLILRLARGGHGPFVQLLFSSVAFSAIHVGYGGEGWSEALPPLLGTMGLGGALGWAFIRSGHSLRPPVIAHVAILILIQPWLALAR
jgi:membrane protease YdiL (CAAX protease family)